MLYHELMELTMELIELMLSQELTDLMLYQELTELTMELIELMLP